jgi:hypothetical protein
MEDDKSVVVNNGDNNNNDNGNDSGNENDDDKGNEKPISQSGVPYAYLYCSERPVL